MMIWDVVDHFNEREACPEWYRWAFLVAVSSSFGYRKLADMMKLRKGK